MRRKFIVLSLAVMMSLAVAPQAFSAGSAFQKSDDSGDRDFAERDEFRQSYQLSPGAKVEVRGINGAVDIETAPGATAEVYIVRSARTREDLNYHKIIVEATATSLVVRGETDGERYGRDRDRASVRQRVTLRLPRQVDLGVSGVNGRVNVGEIDGPVRLSGINGRAEVAQAVGYSELNGINGHVRVTISRLSEQGIRVSGINGGVELRFTDDVNADLDVTGINGPVNADLPNVTLTGKLNRQNVHAKIGSGGSPIRVSGINGSVKLTRAGSAG
jgi:opacity protein-like surface antigen